MYVRHLHHPCACMGHSIGLPPRLNSHIARLDGADARVAQLEAKLSKQASAPLPSGADAADRLGGGMLVPALRLLGPAALLLAAPAACKKRRRLAHATSGARPDLPFNNAACGAGGDGRGRGIADGHRPGGLVSTHHHSAAVRIFKPRGRCSSGVGKQLPAAHHSRL